tara:strand:+ start:280 stop:660 length:381 start_codon:yes stop_codon:yes gene_type:complete
MNTFENMKKEELIKIAKSYITTNEKLGYDLYCASNEVDKLSDEVNKSGITSIDFQVKNELLEKENEKLREKNKELEKENELLKNNDRYDLEKENERLKEQNNGLIASLKFINKMYNLNLDNIINQN